MLDFIFKWPFCKKKENKPHQPKTPTKQNVTKQKSPKKISFTEDFCSGSFVPLNPNFQISQLFFDFWSHPPAFTRRASLIDSGIIQFSSFQVNQFSSWHKACRIKRALPGTKAVLPQSHVSLTVLTACNPELCCCALHKPLSQTFLLFITWPSILPRTCARL